MTTGDSGGGTTAPRPGGRATAAALALTVLLLVLVSLLAGLLVWQGYREAVAGAHLRAASAAHVASAHVRWLIEASFQALRRIDDSLGRRPDLFNPGTVTDLDNAVAAVPGEVLVHVYDAGGNPILSNDPDMEPTGVAGRDFFAALAAGEEWQISPLLNDRFPKRKVFAIGRRIERDGRFLGAAVIYVPASLLAQAWAAMGLGPGSTVGLVRDDGWLVARYPVPERAIDLHDYVLFTRYLEEAPVGTYRNPASPADGQSRTVGYRRLESLPLIAIAGLSDESLITPYLRRVGVALLLAAPIALALLFVTAWVVRLLRQEERSRIALAEALEHNRALFREIHHRVKNNLQTVSALVQMQPGSPEAKSAMTRRIAAMAAVHEHIYQADRYDRVALADYVRKLATTLEEGYGAAPRVTCDLDPVEIEPEAALLVGLIVNEAVTNAYKHAFPDGRDGTIAITLRATPEGHATLSVADDGVGCVPGEDRPPGMGSRLIEGLARQLAATTEVLAGRGTTFVLTVPLTPTLRS